MTDTETARPVSPELQHLLQRMGMSASLGAQKEPAAAQRRPTPPGSFLKSNVEWRPDPGLFTLWTFEDSPSSVQAVLELPPQPTVDAVGEAIEEVIEEALDRLNRVEEPILPPELLEPLILDMRASGGERRVIEDVLSPFMDPDILVAVAQSLPSEPLREDRGEPIRPRAGVTHIGSIEPQPLPGGGRGTANRVPPLNDRSRPSTAPRYLPMMPPPERGRSWGKTAVLGTVMTAAGAAVLWALLGLPVPGTTQAPKATPVARPSTAISISGPSTSAPAAPSSAPASAQAAPSSAPASAQPQSAAPAAPTYATKNGPKTIDQIRSELRLSGYPFGSSTDPRDLLAAYQATAQGLPAPLPAAFVANAPAGSKPGVEPAEWQKPAPSGAWAGRTPDGITEDFLYTAGGPGHEAEAKVNWSRQHTAELQNHGF